MEGDVRQLHSSSEAKVDKYAARRQEATLLTVLLAACRLMMRNLLLGYFHTPGEKRVQVVHVMGKVLDFSHKDLSDIESDMGASGRSGWLALPGFLKKAASTPTPPVTPRKAMDRVRTAC